MFSIKYALDLAKVIMLEPTPSSILLVKWILDAINFRNAYAAKKTGVGLLMFGQRQESMYDWSSQTQF